MLSVHVPRSPFKVCGHHIQPHTLQRASKNLHDPTHILLQENGSPLLSIKSDYIQFNPAGPQLPAVTSEETQQSTN